MVVADNITKYDCTEYELQERIVFWILAAGKSGKIAARITNKLSELPRRKDGILYYYSTYFDIDSFALILRNCGCGCYNQKAQTIIDLGLAVLERDIDLEACSPCELEAIRGIGPKTSRGFILHSRKGARYACLDRHILRWIRDILGIDAPPSTPPKGKRYNDLERIFIQAADARGKTSAELDLEIWNKYRRKVQDEKGEASWEG
jgi:thermostable 8-oxoguanine DNA glycosylase